ncbi:glycerophosphodiester phosphodiesterase family protein [Ancylostoma caninum]|uniref:Glycerophosphodiester phosphodiesterase family protein n=1 Tax=Ancylostoma caninum TaxID=29170 RepID=A0A368HBZ3_ANCCA|nr:glycerophosphodiester phosphodiesterase family protein [Ancylostoma caninum]
MTPFGCVAAFLYGFGATRSAYSSTKCPAKQAKCELVEFDIHLSADAVPVLIHDETTTRTSEENVAISDTSLENIKKIPLKEVSGVGAGIPTLVEAIDWCLQNKMRMIFDVKSAEAKMISSLTQLIKEKNLYDKAIISSFNPIVPYMIKRVDKNILTSFTSRLGYMTYMDDDKRYPFDTTYTSVLYMILDDFVELGIRSFLLPLFLGVDMLLLHYKNINGYLVNDSRSYGMHVIAWTVNKRTTANFLRSINVPFLTDYPQNLSDIKESTPA